jgi:hypothetical protein
VKKKAVKIQKEKEESKVLFRQHLGQAWNPQL